MGVNRYNGSVPPAIRMAEEQNPIFINTITLTNNDGMVMGMGTHVIEYLNNELAFLGGANRTFMPAGSYKYFYDNQKYISEDLLIFSGLDDVEISGKYTVYDIKGNVLLNSSTPSYKSNPWKNLILDIRLQDKSIYRRELTFAHLIKLGLCTGGVATGAMLKYAPNNHNIFTISDGYISEKIPIIPVDNNNDTPPQFNWFRNPGVYEENSGFSKIYNYPYMTFNMKLRRRDEDTTTEIPVFHEIKNFVDDFLYESHDRSNSNRDYYRRYPSYFRLTHSLPKNPATDNFMRAVAKYIKDKPVMGGDIMKLFGSAELHLGGLSTNEFENVGNHMPPDVDEVEMTIDLNREYGSIYDQIKAESTFAFAKINPTIIFHSGAISNCHSMFKGTRGTTNDPKRRLYEVYYSPCKLKVDLLDRKPSGDKPYLGFVPTVIADCFKFSYLNQKSYDAFFLNADMKHCRDFAGAFSEQVFNRVFNAEEDGFAPEMVGHGWGGDYGKITIKCPKKASTPPEEWNDSMLSVWYPGQYDYVANNHDWKTKGSIGTIWCLCKYSHVAAIEPIIDLTYMHASGIYQAFHNPPGQITWPGYRGFRSQIQEVRIRNLGNMDINFAGEVGNWSTTNTPDWNIESMSDASITFLLNNLRDQSLYQPGKENALFLLGAHYKIRIPKTWERLVTGPMVKEIMRKGWTLYIGDSEKSVNESITTFEEEV